MENWVIHVALKRAAVSLASFLAAYAVAHLSGKFGLAIDQAQLTASLLLGAETLRHYLALKFPEIGKYLLLFPLLFLASPSHALKGHLDLNYDVWPVGVRNYTHGFWMGGVEKPLWELDDSSGHSLIELSPIYLHGLLGYNESGGLGIELPITGLGEGLARILDVVKPNLLQNLALPGWAQNLGNFVSVEWAEAYNFNARLPQDKGFFSAIGGRVRIPWGPKSKE